MNEALAVPLQQIILRAALPDGALINHLGMAVEAWPIEYLEPAADADFIEELVTPTAARRAAGL